MALKLEDIMPPRAETWQRNLRHWLKMRKVQVAQIHIMRAEIHECEVIPPWYGIAYWREDVMVAVCYPIPIHAIVGLSRRFYYWFRLAFWENARTRFYTMGRNAGYEAGKLYAEERHARELMQHFNEGYAAGYRAFAATIERMINERWPPRVDSDQRPGSGTDLPGNHDGAGSLQEEAPELSGGSSPENRNHPGGDAGGDHRDGNSGDGTPEGDPPDGASRERREAQD